MNEKSILYIVCLLFLVFTIVAIDAKDEAVKARIEAKQSLKMYNKLVKKLGCEDDYCDSPKEKESLR